MTLRTSIFLSTTFALLALSATGHAQSVSNLGDKTAKANAKAGAAPQQSPYQGAVVADIIARVNDGIISQADYERSNQELEGQAKQRSWSAAELEDQRKQLLRDLIDNQLLLSKGKELGISGETETVRQLDDLRKQNHLESMEDLQKAAEQQGVSFEDFKASIRNRVITSQVIREEVGRRINITQADMQAYYDAHKSEMERPEQVRLSEILVPTADPDNAGQVAEADTKANELEKQLKAGKDFAAVSKASSGGPTAAQGGVIGDFKRGQLAKVLEDQTFDLKAGQYTEPIRTKQGYVILKVDEHQAGGIPTFAEVEPQLQDQIGMEKMNPALRAYLLRLREEAYIDIKPGYVDSGASANEVKPIFSAYQPPQAKKKKKLERTRFGGRGRTKTHPAVQSAKAVRSTVPGDSSSAASGGLPAGVPTLAEVPQGATDQAGSGAPAVAGAPSAASSAKASKALTAANAGTMKPGKKEKIRYGQAPRESLPAGASSSEDAGATAANGNGSNTEQQIAAEQAAPNLGQAGGSGQAAGPGQAAVSGQTNGAAPAGARYSNGESATEEASAASEEKKTRFSDRAKQAKVKKVKKQDRVDPFAAAPAPSEEVATRQTQDAPLGLSGDTSKKPAKVKVSGQKTRYSDETKEDLKAKAEQQNQQNNPGIAPAGTTPLTTPAPTPAPPAAPGALDTPASPAGPSANPDAHAPNGAPPPVSTQDTTNGTGDPLGPTVPAAQPSQAQPH